MAETDILNPVQGFWPALGDNPSWTYDWTRKKAVNKQDTSARLGQPYSRDIGNAGHSFEWNWQNRPYATIQRLEKFYDDFKHGYFTVIDWDGGGRHYVGRFTAPPYPQGVGHNVWTAQGVAFAEQPRARMLVYPSNFAVDGHPIYVIDDYLTPRMAMMQGTWIAHVSPAAPATTSSYGGTYSAPAAVSPQSWELLLSAPVAGDWAQAEYVGWGFQIPFRLDPTFGLCDIYIDDAMAVTGLDLSNGAVAAMVATGGVVTVGGGEAIVSVTQMSLDVHRIKVVARNVAGSLGGVGVIFPAMEYIY